MDKKLRKKGMLSPVENLRIRINEVNSADEISFTYYKEVNNRECLWFHDLDALCVIEVEDYGFFECAVTKNDNASVYKTVVGRALGYSELSQLLATLEINTEDDTARLDYDVKYPTVFYRKIPSNASNEEAKKLRESSLLHRILTYAPHYKIGHVDETLQQIQRTFSWSDTDIVRIFNDIAQEINCVFDIQVRKNEEGNAERIINVYDAQYCKKCWDETKQSGEIASPSHYRNIINGVCQSCGESLHVKGVGEDTGICISTTWLSNDIVMDGDKDSVKNCFKIVGGDDVITNTVQGLSMASSGKIMKFSDLQKKSMSAGLLQKLDQYDKDYKEHISDYERLLETEYNIYDMKLYLQSGKMPPIEKEITTTDGALYSVLEKISTYYNNTFYISSYKNYSMSGAKSSIRNLFTTFMPEGYSFSIDTDDITGYGEDYNESTTYQWYGKIKVYNTGNRNDYYVLHVEEGRIPYVTHLDDDRVHSEDKQTFVNTFKVVFTFADKKQSEYMGYLEQHTKYLLSTVDLSYENEKKRNWDEFSYNRLESFYDGYKTCIDSLQSMMYESEEGSAPYKILSDLITSYTSIQNDIHRQMLVLKDQIFALCSYSGSYDNEFINDAGDVVYSLQHYTSIDTIFANLINPSLAGGYNSSGTYTVNQFIGSKPFKCKKCGSTNVSVSTTGNVCNNPGCGGKGSDIYTYLDIMEDIVQSYNIHKKYSVHENDTLLRMRARYQERFEPKTYFDEELYTELLSYIREDIYTNDNFTSDGLTNAELIQQAKELKAKAEQELDKACQIQYTITASLSPLLGQQEFVYQGVVIPDDYDGFKINNYVRVDIDDTIYKMRIATIDIAFPVKDKIDVTFTNVTSHNDGVMGDIPEVIRNARSMATTYDYVATQAEKGAVANSQFDTLKREGLDAGLMAVKAGQNQDVVIDNHGILLRKKNEETGEYSKYQTRIINNNIVMTDDNWETAQMAIGLGMYNKQLLYGIWANLLYGDLTVTKELHVKNDDSTVIIDENGITLDGGAIKWVNKLPSTAVEGYDTFKENVRKMLGATTITANSVISPKIIGGYLYIVNGDYSVEIDPNNTSSKTKQDFLFCINNTKGDFVVMGVDNKGNGYFDGEINARKGKLAGFDIEGNDIVCSNTDGTLRLFSSGSPGLILEYFKENALTHKDSVVTTNISSGHIYQEDEFGRQCNIRPELILLTGEEDASGKIPSTVIGSNQIYAEQFVSGSGSSITSSDKWVKHSICDINNASDFILKLQPCKFKYNNGTSDRNHFGFIAQDVEETMLATTGDAGIFVKYKNPNSDDTDDICGLRYEEFIAPMVATIQSLNDKIEKLESKIETLENKLKE